MSKIAGESSKEYLERVAKEGKHIHLCVVCGDEWECANHICDAEPGGVLTVYGHLDDCRKCCGLAGI
jgi:hypothetical protein